MFMMSTAFICCSESVQLDTKWGGAKGFFSGVGLFLLKATGPGDLFMTAYGAVHPVNVEGSYIVDTGHIVAFPETVQYHIRKVGGIKSLFSLVKASWPEFNGQGTVWLQTRNGNSLANFLQPFRPGAIQQLTLCLFSSSLSFLRKTRSIRSPSGSPLEGLWFLRSFRWLNSQTHLFELF